MISYPGCDSLDILDLVVEQLHEDWDNAQPADDGSETICLLPFTNNTPLKLQGGKEVLYNCKMKI